MATDVKPIRCALHVSSFCHCILVTFYHHPQVLSSTYSLWGPFCWKHELQQLWSSALCVFGLSSVSRSLIATERVCLVQTMLALCCHGSSFFFSFLIACVQWSIYRQAFFVSLIREASHMQHSKQPQPDLRLVCVHVSILCQLSVFHTAACTCELRYVREANTVSRLRRGGNDERVVAKMEFSHVLSRATGPLIPISQSDRGCWEQAVLGNDLAGGLRDGEGSEGTAHTRGR